uniref:Di19 C-terminal domain-containing protein n=1 Tax=Aegilops tauschii subsp. strangulata TaxID=200361 RepID=A0A452YXH4_AEGTS
MEVTSRYPFLFTLLLPMIASDFTILLCPLQNTWFLLEDNLFIAFLNEKYMQRRRRVRKVSSGSHSLLSLLRKDLRDGSLQSFLGGSSYVSNPPAAAPDPFLQSLICSLPVAEPSKDFRSESSDKTFLLNKFPDEKIVERYVTSSFVLSAASLRFLFATMLLYLPSG